MVNILILILEHHNLGSRYILIRFSSRSKLTKKRENILIHILFSALIKKNNDFVFSSLLTSVCPGSDCQEGQQVNRLNPMDNRFNPPRTSPFSSSPRAARLVLDSEFLKTVQKKQRVVVSTTMPCWRFLRNKDLTLYTLLSGCLNFQICGAYLC